MTLKELNMLEYDRLHDIERVDKHCKMLLYDGPHVIASLGACDSTG